MEPNGLPGGIFSGIGAGMLGLEMPLHPQQNPQNPHHLQQHQQMVSYAPHDADHPQQTQQSIKQGYPYGQKPKQASLLSDEDDHGFNPDDSTGDGKRKISPWQRMKWTDSMVRLLIMAVYYIGDEAGSEANDKKKDGALLQKKGKWKSVSRAMMEKGFYVSPQQCEDKFNDLNKRYKRVNDILGKGTACRVVENQSLLETMDLSPKMKEEVRKLLNSKHLFFREMCAYHNSCGHGAATTVVGGPSGANGSSSVQNDASQVQHQQSQQQRQRCLHSSENAHSSRSEADGSKMGRTGSEEDDDEEDDTEDDDDEEDDEEEGNSRGQNGHRHEDHDNEDNKFSSKRQRIIGPLSSPQSPLMQQLSSEVTSVIQDGTRNGWEKKQWLKMRLLQLEEQQVSYQCQAFELEKQRLKWVKFSSKKEREMERAKLENERRRLESDRMVLLVRQKELELLHVQHHHHHHQQQNSSNKRSDPSSVTG
ncbi:KNR4/SMI1 homolog isoform X1 [Carica papaya]|uniref:KNR4/SMI1 homolog isoform X1 n=2 Tax=Carica papaya TaxID=3649 RepID=UPI000B8C75BC|nr:KNR4/SMI1 homolog isoform X1 [Carica papaya]XP_021908804.1 KNR4/SMI1 homolog isoform X1 [Carica papaya]